MCENCNQRKVIYDNLRNLTPAKITKFTLCDICRYQETTKQQKFESLKATVYLKVYETDYLNYSDSSASNTVKDTII